MSVTSSAPLAPQETSLAKGVLGLPSIVFQSLIGAGPAITIALNIAYGASLAGAALPFAFIVGSLTVICVAIIVAQFSRYLPAAGAYFTYTSRGLGAVAGFFTGWTAVLYGLVFPAIPTLILSTILPAYVTRLIGVDVPWWVFTIVLLGVIWATAYLGVKQSVRVAMVTGTIELAVVLLVIVGAIIKGGSSNSIAFFGPGSAGLSPVLSSLVFVFLSFGGFEGVADLAEEAHQPRRNVGRAVVTSVIVLGLVYTLASYAGIVGFGGDAAALAGDSNPFDTLIRQIADPLWVLLAFAFLNSGLGGGLAGMVIAQRNLFAMGRAGVLPAAFASVHPKHKTPYVATHFMLGFSLVVALVLGFQLGSGNAFALLGTTYTVALLVMYLMSAIALPVFYMREHRSEFNVIWHLAIPVIAGAIIIAALYSLVNPAPAEPIVYALPIAGVWMVIGLVAALVLRSRGSRAFAEGGAKIFIPESDN
jgi:amino acid transporter